jgi:hypothetical protein
MLVLFVQRSRHECSLGTSASSPTAWDTAARASTIAQEVGAQQEESRANKVFISMRAAFTLIAVVRIWTGESRDLAQNEAQEWGEFGFIYR